MSITFVSDVTEIPMHQKGLMNAHSVHRDGLKRYRVNLTPFAIEIYNAPATQPWYYIANEGGTESDDCALVPPSVLHVPTGNDKMFESTTDEQYLPVLSCPFGYSSQPGTYIIDDIWQLRSILLENQDIMVEPYISMEERLLESNQMCRVHVSRQQKTNVKYVIPETSEVCALLNARADDGGQCRSGWCLARMSALFSIKRGRIFR